MPDPLMYSRTADRRFSRTNLLAFQHGLCAGCFDLDPATLYVDHDHATGKVRALLCPSCNSGEGSRVYGWARFVASTPAEEFHHGLPSALPSFIVRAEEAEAKKAAYVHESWEWGFSDFATWTAKEERRLYERWDHPRDRYPHPVFEALDARAAGEKRRIHDVVRRAIVIDQELLNTVAQGDCGPAGWVHRDLEIDLMSRWWRNAWEDRESEIRQTMAAGMPMHAFAYPTGDDRTCAFQGCGVLLGQHPTYRGIDEDYPALARIRTRLAGLYAIRDAGQAAA